MPASENEVNAKDGVAPIQGYQLQPSQVALLHDRVDEYKRAAAKHQKAIIADVINTLARELEVHRQRKLSVATRAALSK